MRILFVAMSESIHTVRHIKQLQGQGWDIHLFPSREPFIHPEFENVTIHSSAKRPPNLAPSVHVRGRMPPPLNTIRHILGQKHDRLAIRHQRLPAPLRAMASPFVHMAQQWSDRPRQLAQLIRRLKPDLVHSLEIQHGGYLTLDAKRLLDRFPPWIVTNWGNDTYYFGRLNDHIDRIKAVFAACDYYDCEGYRDVEAARRFGFRGGILPVTPNTGGYHLDYCRSLRQPGPTSARRTIAVKGYQSWAGRSLIALRAIELCADVLQGYRIAVYLGNSDVTRVGELLTHDTGIPVDVIPHGPHETMLKLHGRSRISIGCSISDGVSTSFLEALVMGSYPIQSYTATCDDWITDGETGSIIHPMDPQSVAAALRRAVTDDALVDHAAEINAVTARERLAYDVVQRQVVESYQKIFAAGNEKAVFEEPRKPAREVFCPQ